MTDYHTTYKGPEGQTTEWDDLQVKHGNKEPAPKPAKAEAWTDPDRAPARDAAWLDSKTEDELADLDEEFDDERFLDAYRRQRMADLKKAAQAKRFGSVVDIGGADFVREVTHAGPEVWVVLHLYKDGVPECRLLGDALDVLAERYPGTKFLRCVSTDCIPQYPDRNLPTLLLYRDTKCLQTLVGLLHYGGRRLTPERAPLQLHEVAFALNRFGPICRTEGETQQEVSEGDIKALLQKLATMKAAELEAASGQGDE